MVCKMLLFEHRDSEKLFFDKNRLSNFDINFYTHTLNEKSIQLLNPSDLEEAIVLSVYKFSRITEEVLSHFKNLRILSLRCDDFKHIDLRACLERNIAVIKSEAGANSEYQILKKSFKDITDVFCGCKESRIV